MKSNIFTQSAGIHLIDLEKTEKQLKEAAEFIKEIAAKGGQVLFLATKKQSGEVVKSEAERIGALFLTQRWFGGLLTNFDSVRKTIEKLDTLEGKIKEPEGFKKKEVSLMQRDADKLKRTLGGVRGLNKLPQALFIVDSRKEDNAVREAEKMGIPVVALVDTNADPTKVPFPIAANDDSVKSVSLLVKTIADAYEEGKSIHEKKMLEVEKAQEKAASKEIETKPKEPEKVPVV